MYNEAMCGQSVPVRNKDADDDLSLADKDALKQAQYPHEFDYVRGPLFPFHKLSRARKSNGLFPPRPSGERRSNGRFRPARRVSGGETGHFRPSRRVSGGQMGHFRPVRQGSGG